MILLSAGQEISATFKQYICDMQFNAVAVALKSRIAMIDRTEDYFGVPLKLLAVRLGNLCTLSWRHQPPMVSETNR